MQWNLGEGQIEENEYHNGTYTNSVRFKLYMYHTHEDNMVLIYDIHCLNIKISTFLYIFLQLNLICNHLSHLYRPLSLYC